VTDLPLSAGDTLRPAQLSPCVGGLVRTWTESGTRLWSVPEGAAGDVLAAVQGTGVLARSERGEQRFRETALLHEESGTLMLSPRFSDRSAGEELAFQATTVQLEPYAFFALHVDDSGRQLSTVEVAPPPKNSELWEPHLRPGAGATVSAPVSAEAFDGATFYLADAVAGFDLLPWDVAFTFGVREAR
jgi:hypothetical protein